MKIKNCKKSIKMLINKIVNHNLNKFNKNNLKKSR